MTSAAIYAGMIPDYLEGSAGDPISILNIPPDTNRIVAYVEYETAKEPDDHPGLAAGVFILAPDGTRSFKGGGGSDSWGGGMHRSALHASGLRQSGPYVLEIRPIRMPNPEADPSPNVEPAGERALARLLLEVTHEEA